MLIIESRSFCDSQRFRVEKKNVKKVRSQVYGDPSGIHFEASFMIVEGERGEGETPDVPGMQVQACISLYKPVRLSSVFSVNV